MIYFGKENFLHLFIKKVMFLTEHVSPNYEGLDALLESERIRNEMFTFEHDLWHF